MGKDPAVKVDFLIEKTEGDLVVKTVSSVDIDILEEVLVEKASAVDVLNFEAKKSSKPKADDIRYESAGITKESFSQPPLETLKHAVLDEHIYIGSASDIDENDSEQSDKAHYNPWDYFQYQIEQAGLKSKKYKKSVLLAMPYGSLVVLADAKIALLNISESKLRAFCALPVIEETLTIIFIDNDELEQFRKNASEIGFKQLLWKSAIWASRGRIPVTSSFTDLVFFDNGSNLSKLLLFTHALEIEALWKEKNYSLIETAKALKIPQRYVFSFYSASNAIGLASIRSDSRKSRSHEKKQMISNNILGNMLSRFHRVKI